MDKLCMNLLSRDVLYSKEIGRMLLDCICARTPQLVPEVYGNWEPLRNRFDCKMVDDALESWRWPFLWKTRKPRSQGSVWPNSPRGTEWGAISMSAEYAEGVFRQLMDLFFAWCSIVKPDFGCLQRLTELEVKRGIQVGVVSPVDRRRTKFMFLITEHELKKSVPDLYWATVFGPLYISYFGRERLLSAPAYQVREIGNDNVYLQLSASIQDMNDRPEEIAKARQAIKKHLGEGSFFDPALGRDYPYLTPWPAAPAPANQDRAGRSVKEDCDYVMKQMLPVAETMLEEHGEFYPYGGIMRTDGTVEHVSAYDGQERPRPRDLIDLLTGAFREHARQGHIRASAIVCDVYTVPPGGKERTSAIQVRLDHVESYSVEVYIPYRIVSKRKVEMGESFTQAGAHSIFVHK